MHGVFWLFTQPVNRFWLRETELGRAGAAFFRMRAQRDKGGSSDWTMLRDQWEYSHLARAVLAFAALGLLAVSIAVR
jgi:hypothetical protein